MTLNMLFIALKNTGEGIMLAPPVTTSTSQRQPVNPVGADTTAPPVNPNGG